MSTLVFLIFFIFSFYNEITSYPRIVNGTDAQPGQFPWHALVLGYFSDTDRIHYCSGAIIDKNWILTAAHCINGAYMVHVRLGSINTESGGILQMAPDFFVYKDFDNSTLENDIALVQIDSFTSNDNVSSVPLSDEDLQTGVVARVSGWGHSNHDDEANLTHTLQYGVVSTIDNADCQKIYGDVVQPSVVCSVGPAGESPCIGDGGAPLVINAETNPVLVGIFSFISSLGCGGEYPAGYSRVAPYRTWIEGILSTIK